MSEVKVIEDREFFSRAVRGIWWLTRDSDGSVSRGFRRHRGNRHRHSFVPASQLWFATKRLIPSVR